MLCVHVWLLEEYLTHRPPSVAWEVRKITSPSKPFTNPHTRPHPQTGKKYSGPSVKRCLNFRLQGSAETCSEAPLTQTPPTTVTMTTAVLDTKATEILRSLSQTAETSESCAPSGITMDTSHQAPVAQIASVSPQPSSVNVAKLITKTSGHATMAQTLSWADRVRGKVSKDREIKCHPGTTATTTVTTATSAHGPIVVSRGKPSNAATTASLNVGAIEGKVAEVCDGWELAHSRHRTGRRSRKLHSSKKGEILADLVPRPKDQALKQLPTTFFNPQ